ncbi:MAG: AmmeMemoRadiSam system protein B, partial [Proteobacteria bacterium]|nr:AmmeMemoRadiSam system protein B [Pseudomonadota bacterium]
NTIEVQLPIIKALFNDCRVGPIRIPAGVLSVEIGEYFSRLSNEQGKKTAMIGSTDLTHYGSAYNFTPEKSLESPAEWVAESDKNILDAMVSMKTKEILRLAESERSACSPGAAASVVSFAVSKGIQKGQLLSYYTSLSRHQAESFVGYGNIIY